MPHGLPSSGSAPAVASPGARGSLGGALLLLASCQALSGLSDYEVGGAGGGATSASSNGSTSATGGGTGEGGAGGSACAPAAEICGNGLDEDCDATDCSATAWATALGGARFQVPYDAAVLPDGAVAVAGTYSEGAMTIGDDVLPPVTKDRFGIFLAVLEPDGTPRWGFGVPDGAGSLPAVAAGTDGAVFLGGRFAGTLDVGGEVLAADAGGDAFVARFGEDGAGAWATAFAGSGAATVRDLEVRAGEVLVAGSFTTSIAFGPGVELVASGEGGEGGGPSTPDVDGFLATLDADLGDAVAARGVGSAALATMQGVAGAGHVGGGDLAIVAPFVDSIALGEPHAGPAGFAVARLAEDGSAEWRRFVQTPDVFTSGLDVQDVAIGGDRIVVVGRVHGTWEHVDPDAGSTTSFAETAGDRDLFVAVWSGSGDLLWTEQLGDATDQSWLFELIGAAVTDDGAVTLAAGFRGEVDPGSGPVSSESGDWLVASWSAAGDLRWSRTIVADGGSDGATCVAIDPASGDAIVGGTTMAPLDVTDPPLQPIADAAPTVVVARFSD